MEKNIICTVCPRGCQVKVTLSGKEVADVSGYGCKRGKEYLVECPYLLSALVRIKIGHKRVHDKAACAEHMSAEYGLFHSLGPEGSALGRCILHGVSPGGVCLRNGKTV